MQLKIHRTIKLIFFYNVIILILSCGNKNNSENQITIIINSIDNKTKQHRVNMFDTIDVRIAEFGFPKKKYVKIAEYITDSKGSVRVKLDSNEEYHFILGGSYIYGAEEFSSGELKDGQEINIEVISLENR